MFLTDDELFNLMLLKASTGKSVEAEASGNPVTFLTDLAKPLKSLLIPFTPKQTGSGEPSPTNIRPIVPWNGVTVNHSGADTSEYTSTDISFPSPVYGGTLDAVTGVLTDGWKTETFDGSSDELWNFTQVGTSAFYRAYIRISDIAQDNDVAILADKYKAVSFDNRSFSQKVCMATNKNESPQYVSFITDETTVEAFKAWLAENPVTIAYMTATPQEIALTPQQITALVGNNTIWSDANGDCEVTFLKKGS